MVKSSRVLQIEGLRAVCVLLVLLFHIFPNRIPSGYLGVDAFFAISGYVVTRLLSHSMARHSFSFLDFYTSRAIRLMPALMVTIILTILSFRYLFGTTDYHATVWSGVAAALSASNIWFWYDAGYFSESSAFKPLLHTWSLGVEEQFYIFWPLIYFYFIRDAANRKAIIFSIALAGAATALVFSKSSADSVFYLSPFRFYQFMLGAGFAAMPPAAQFTKALQANGRLLSLVPLAAMAAMTIMALAAYHFGPGQIFVQFLVSLLAAGSCWYCEMMERVDRASLLSAWPAVLIGSRSYAIYLAHWPLVVASKAIWGEQLSLLIKLPLFGESILAGFLLSAFVERPIRLRGARDPHYALKRSATAVLALACLGLGWSSTSLDSKIASASPLDLPAILVAGGEIERSEIRPLAQQRVDAADPLEPDRPVHIVDEAQAQYDVAGGHIAAGKRLVFGDDDFLGVGARFLKFLLQPLQRPAGVLGTVAQPIEQLGGEGRVARVGCIARQDGLTAPAVVGSDHPVGDVVGHHAHVARAADPNREPAQVFNQHEAQQRRQRPDLADAHRLHGLEALDDRLEHLGGNRTVGMRDIGPGQHQCTRNALPVRKCQRGKLAIETARKIALDLVDRLFHQIIVIQQPLRGGRDYLAPPLGRIGQAVDFENLLRVFADTRLEIERHQPGHIPSISPGKALAQAAQTVFRQELRADRLFRRARNIRAGLFDLRGAGLNVH